MPVVMVLNSFKFIIYFFDHEPAHIHVVKNECEAKITILDVECFYCRGFTERDIAKLEKFVRENRVLFIKKWKELRNEK